MNLDELLIANLQNLADAEKLLVAGLPAMVEAASKALLQQSRPGRDVRVVALPQTSSRLNVKLFTKD
ncbi:MAG: hypothetical protein ACRYFU_11660, partial [Janthinobacterium lividum]